MYRTILVPLDGSDLSNAALPHAVALAGAGREARVVLLTVVDSEASIIARTSSPAIDPLPGGRLNTEIAEEAVRGQQEAAKRTLGAAAAKLEALGLGAPVSLEVVEGHPGEAICDAADRLRADVVVIATHGRSGIRRAILGSVADYVARHTPHAAVLLVRPVET